MFIAMDLDPFPKLRRSEMCEMSLLWSLRNRTSFFYKHSAPTALKGLNSPTISISK